MTSNPKADADYFAIRPGYIRGDQKITFNCYVKVGGKYILYCREGESFEHNRLKRLIEKKLNYFYIEKDRQYDYEAYLRGNMDMAFDKSSGKDIDLRVQILHGALQSSSEDLMDKPENEIQYEATKHSMFKFQDFIEEEGALRSVLNLENAQSSIAHHSVNVAALAISISRLLSPENPHEFVGTGALMHDIEHFMTKFPIDKDPSQHTDDEKLIYMKHPMAGGERLEKLKHIDKTVLSIVREHEELIDGTGFPNKLTEKDLHPMSLVVGLANSYDRYMSFRKMTPKDALKNLLVYKMGQYPLTMLQALQELLKMRGVLID